MPVVIKSRERVVNAFVEKLFVEWNDVICLLFGKTERNIFVSFGLATEGFEELP